MVYVTGDMHGDKARFNNSALKKLKKDDLLIILGDFGFVWDDSEEEKKFLKKLGNLKHTVAFLDGTHENYTLLNAYRETLWNGGRVNRISGNLFRLQRGQVYKINGNNFFVFGGGESIDKELRVENVTWWREELPTIEEMNSGAENVDKFDCKMDYILTHEPPSIVKSSILLRSGKSDKVNKLNGYLEELDKICKFKCWYFGSMHEDRVITQSHTSVFKDIVAIEGT